MRARSKMRAGRGVNCSSFAGYSEIDEKAMMTVRQYQEHRPEFVIFDSRTHE